MNPIELYGKMTEAMNEGKFQVVIDTMLREEMAMNEEVAKNKMDAFFQWFSILGEGGRYQMTEKVDKAWHAIVLNTELYRNFCDEYAGQFIDHNPLDVVSNTDEQKTAYAKVTLTRLKEVYGTALNPLLEDLSQPMTCCCGCNVVQPGRIANEAALALA